MLIKSHNLSIIFFTFFALCLPAHVQADPINFFNTLSPQHKAKFIIASMACLAGAVVGCAINLKTNAPANGAAANSDDSVVTFPNTAPKIIGTLICAVMTVTGYFFANEASYGR